MTNAKRRLRSEGREQTYRNARRLGWLFSALVALFALCVVFFMWLVPVRVVDESMSPALLSGEVVLCDRMAKFVNAPERGDVILFQTPDGVFLKRIVGLPGESVELVNGHVFIDSRPLDESEYVTVYAGDMAPLAVPEGSLFVLGDNREQMYDSRLESVGCIPFEQIEGILRVRVSPIEKLTFFS